MGLGWGEVVGCASGGFLKISEVRLERFSLVMAGDEIFIYMIGRE
jgi:hypothetical protein